MDSHLDLIEEIIHCRLRMRLLLVIDSILDGIVHLLHESPGPIQDTLTSLDG